MVQPGKHNSMCTFDPFQAVHCCSGGAALGRLISTDIKDFIGQFAFLGVQPFADKAYFNRVVFISLHPCPLQCCSLVTETRGQALMPLPDRLRCEDCL